METTGKKGKRLFVGMVALLFLFFTVSIAWAEKRTFSGIGEYTMSDYDTPAVAEQRAVAYAKRHAAEQAGVYVETYTKSEGMQITEDEVRAMMSSALRVVSQRTSKQPLSNGDVHIRAELIAEVDTAALEAFRQQSGEQRERITRQRAELQKAIDKQEAENEALRRKIDEMKAKALPPDRSLEIQAMVNEFEFLSNGKVEEGMNCKDLEQTILHYNEALEWNPKCVEAYNNRGCAYDDKGEYDRAIVDYSCALELNPKCKEVYINRGISYDNKREYDRAIADYTRALELEPKYAEAYVNRGISYSNKGEYDRAITDYTRALELNPKYAEAYFDRGLSYSNKGDYDRAITDYTRALELNPKYAKAYFNRALAYGHKKEYQKAIADWDSVLQFVPNDAEAKRCRQMDVDAMNGK